MIVTKIAKKGLDWRQLEFYPLVWRQCIQLRWGDLVLWTSN